MTVTPFESEGVNYLFEFFSAFNDWECETDKQYRLIDWPNWTEEEDEKWWNDRRSSLVAIFSQYCEAGKYAKRFKDKGLHFRGRPLHDPNFEKMVSSIQNENIITVETRCENEGWWAQYEVIRLTDGWKVRDVRRWKCTPDSKWSRDLL